MSPQKSYLGKIWFSIVLSLSGILILGITIFNINHSLIRGIKRSEWAYFKKASFLLKEKMDSFIHGMQGIGGIYHSSKFNPHPKVIRDYAAFSNFFNNSSGALGFGFVRRVEKSKLPNYIFQRRSMEPNFSFKEYNQTNFKDAYVIEVVEPLENNLQALGLNVETEPVRRLSIERAMDSGEARLTSPLNLIQKSNDVGFTYFMPVYSQPEIPASIEERRKKLIGWAYAPIHSAGLFEFLDKSIDHRLVLDIRDSSGQSILKPNQGVDSRYEDNNYWMQQSLNLGGRTWIVRGAVTPNGNVLLINILSVLLFCIVSIVYAILIWKLRQQVYQKEIVEERAKEIEGWQSAVLNGSPYLIISTFPDGRVTTFNRAAERLLGYKAYEVIGKVGHEFIHDPDEIKSRAEALATEVKRDIPVGFDTFTNIIKEDGFNTNEWTYIHKDGTRIPVRLCITDIKNEDQEIIGYLGIGEDLREFKKIQATNELQRVTMMSNAKMAALGEMAGGMAHEINNPLAIIAGHTMVLRRMHSLGELDEKSLGNGLSKIDDTCQRIGKIVKGLRAFSRDTDQDPKDEVPVNRIIEDTLDLCQQRISNNNIQLTIHIENESILNCRPVQISQVLLNLLSNALDAINHLKDKWILIKVMTMENNLIITVTDSGSGIDLATVERMMEPFFTTKDPGKGTGLGLSISKGIIEDHGGHLTYATHEGHTQFCIELPLA